MPFRLRDAEVLSMLAEVRQCLERYEQRFRRPGLPALELKGMYALFPEEGLEEFVESRWNDPYPNAERAGLYLIYGRTGALLFIGKASLGALLGRRLGTHFAGKTECRPLSSDWTERPTYIATIAVPPGMSFEAAALEEYLIRCLKPSDNKLPLNVDLELEALIAAPEPMAIEAASSSAPLGPDVYTYSAPGLPMCPVCGERPSIFYCSTHDSAACLECVAKHDVRGECVYVPAYRAPKPVAGQATVAEPPPSSVSKPRGILGI